MVSVALRPHYGAGIAALTARLRFWSTCLADSSSESGVAARSLKLHEIWLRPQDEKYCGTEKKGFLLIQMPQRLLLEREGKTFGAFQDLLEESLLCFYDPVPVVHLKICTFKLLRLQPGKART